VDSKRVLLYGESWRGTMAYSVKLALEENGYSVDTVDPSVYQFHAGLIGKVDSIMDRVFFRKIAYAINAHMQELLRTRKYTIVVIIKGLHVWPETITLSRKLCGRAVNWNHDEFFNPLRGAGHIWSPYIEQAFKEYEVIITPRRHLAESYLAKGARRVEYLPFACDPEIHQPRVPSAQDVVLYSSEIIFVGNWSPLRQNVFSKLIDSQPLTIWGASWWRSGWKFSTSPNCRLKGIIPQDRMSLLLACSKIALNMYTRENSDRYTIRNFEIPAARVFQLAERTVEATGFFEEDSEAVYFSTAEELIDKCRFYLAHDEARRKIAEAGYRRFISSGYTYRDRVRDLIGRLS